MIGQAKSLIITTGTLGLGMGIACHAGLYVGARTTNLLIDGVIVTKDLGSSLVAKTFGVKDQFFHLLVNASGYSEAKFKEQLEKIRDRGANLVGESSMSRISEFLNYIDRFEDQLSTADSVEKVNKHVFVEAYQKFTEAYQWINEVIYTFKGSKIEQ